MSPTAELVVRQRVRSRKKEMFVFFRIEGYTSHNCHSEVSGKEGNLPQKLHTHLVIFSADNLRVSQIQAHSSVVMGKNSFMRRSLQIHAPSAGKPAFVGAIPHINGKVGLILTDCDPEEVSETAAGYKLQPLVCSSMDIGMCSLWQWLLGFHMNLLTK
ncbi:putative ribosomal protein L10-like domain superfamily [Helianthus annuus]|uniref:Uncharacterized protein n=1 Tax=Helianthus annuus TaxID=4232 RepID=A0A251U404_HELAN|nr:putative ribosomal protein L10-like domain superfamily [Helianthus annuus]